VRVDALHLGDGSFQDEWYVGVKTQPRTHGEPGRARWKPAGPQRRPLKRSVNTSENTNTNPTVWPQMNADERGLKTRNENLCYQRSSAFIGG
jgi:hypothetical protein